MQNKKGPIETIKKGKGNILLVEDDAIFRVMIEKTLNELGYDAVLAVDGLEAIRIYESKWSQIDLVIMDIVMPKMGGYECFIALKAINPFIKVIISSGYDKREEVKNILKEGGKGFLKKPYPLKDLSALLAKTI